jgi:hypothetical protein
MTKHKLTLAVFLLGHWACNVSQNSIKSSSVKTKSLSGSEQAKPEVSSGDGSVYSTAQGTDGVVDTVKKPDEPQDEGVSIPSAISGALLFCQDISDSLLPKHKKQVGCSLKNDDGRSMNRDLSGHKSHKWSFASQESSGTLISDQPSSLTNQAVFLVTANDNNPSAFINARLNITLDYVAQDDRPFESKTSLELQILRWVPLNNRAIPKNALIAGTENNGTVQSPICRYHYGNQLIPGKVQTDYKGGSVCFGSVDGTYITTGSTYYDTDVLISDVDSTQYFEWISTTDGVIPELAFQGGTDAAGKAVFVCRGNTDSAGKPYPSTAAYPNGEPSPGYAKNDGKGCNWQYYDLVNSKKFEILVWKSDAIRKMMK